MAIAAAAEAGNWRIPRFMEQTSFRVMTPLYI
jgi:hypothetical protein